MPGAHARRMYCRTASGRPERVFGQFRRAVAGRNVTRPSKASHGPTAGLLSRRQFVTAGLVIGVNSLAAGTVSGAFSGVPTGSPWPRNGCGLENSNFNPLEKSLDRGTVGQLELKWKTSPTGPIQNAPVVIEQSLYFGTWDHDFIAVNVRSGETRWKFSPEGNSVLPAYERGIRSTANFENGHLYFIDTFTVAHCIDAATGESIWQTRIDNDSVRHMAHARFSPAVFENRLIVAHAGLQPQIACLDTDTGRILWRFYTGLGGSPWTSAAIDTRERVVYNVTGDPKQFKPGDPMLYTNCMLANDLDTGELLWYQQVTAQDARNLDFSCHPMIYDAKGRLGALRQSVGAGNKRGFYSYDRYTGELYWKTSLTAPHQAGGPLANSTAVAYNRVFLASNAASAGNPLKSIACALNAYDGNIEWWVLNQAMVSCGVAVANGIFFLGQADGLLQALDAETGARLWEYRLPSTCRGVAVADGVLYAAHGEVYVIDGKGLSDGYSVHAFTAGGR